MRAGHGSARDAPAQASAGGRSQTRRMHSARRCRSTNGRRAYRRAGDHPVDDGARSAGRPADEHLAARRERHRWASRCATRRTRLSWGRAGGVMIGMQRDRQVGRRELMRHLGVELPRPPKFKPRSDHERICRRARWRHVSQSMFRPLQAGHIGIAVSSPGSRPPPPAALPGGAETAACRHRLRSLGCRHAAPFPVSQAPDRRARGG